MTKLVFLLGVVIFVAGCEERRALTFPSGIAPPTATSPPVPPPPVPPLPPPNTREPGPVLTAATRITPGEIVLASIELADPACFPNWDSAGHCRQYELTAPTDGTLLATLRVSGPSRGFYNPELFLVAPDASWYWAPEEWPERRLRLQARQGESYRIVVLAYGPFPEAFQVTADVVR
jgi:hypothetical protein